MTPVSHTRSLARALVIVLLTREATGGCVVDRLVDFAGAEKDTLVSVIKQIKTQIKRNIWINALPNMTILSGEQIVANLRRQLDNTCFGEPSPASSRRVEVFLLPRFVSLACGPVSGGQYVLTNLQAARTPCMLSCRNFRAVVMSLRSSAERHANVVLHQLCLVCGRWLQPLSAGGTLV